MLNAGDGAGGYTRSAFEIFRRDAGQRYAPDLIARGFPDLPRHAQHRIFARPGMADHERKIASVRDMRQRVGLLARQDKTARLRMRQSRYAIPVTRLMALPLGHEFGGTVQALFRLDHLARGEPILAASILAQFDQTRCAAHRTYHLVELIDPIAVPMRELRHVALRKGRLLLRDGVQCDGRIGDNPLAIAACDLALQFGAVGGLHTPALDALRG